MSERSGRSLRKRVGGKPVRRPSLLEHLGTRHSRLLTRVLWALDGRGSACRCDDRTRLKFRGPSCVPGGLPWTKLSRAESPSSSHSFTSQMRPRCEPSSLLTGRDPRISHDQRRGDKVVSDRSSVGVGPRCARPLRQSRNVWLPDELPRRRRRRSRLREREGSPWIVEG